MVALFEKKMGEDKPRPCEVVRCRGKIPAASKLDSVAKMARPQER